MEVPKHIAVYNFKYKKFCSDQNIHKIKGKIQTRRGYEGSEGE